MSATATDLDPALVEHLLDGISEAIPPGPEGSSGQGAARAGDIRRTAARLFLLALRPADPFQAMLAAQIVSAHYAIMDAYRRAAQPDLAPALAIRLRANAATLSRTMQATLRTLRQQPAAALGAIAAQSAPKPAASRRPVTDAQPRTAPVGSLPGPSMTSLSTRRTDDLLPGYGVPCGISGKPAANLLRSFGR